MDTSKRKTIIFTISVLAFIGSVVNMPKEPMPLERADVNDSPQQSLEKVFSDHLLSVGKNKEAAAGELHMGDAIIQPSQARWLYGLDPIGRSAIRGDKYRWTNAIIPYVIDCSLENLPSAVEATNAAIAEWEAKTCIRFVKRTNEKKYLKIFRHTHCWAYVGMVEGSSLSVGYGCEYANVMAHELGHVIGFFHEHNRKDRDSWVDVLWRNIGQFTSAFEKTTNGEYHSTPYDYASIMHYPWNAFSLSGDNTLQPKRARTKKPYVSISEQDIIQTNRMYNCPAIERKRAGQLRAINAQLRAELLAPAQSIDLPDHLTSSEKLDKLISSSNQIGGMVARASVEPVGTKGCVDWSSSCADWKRSGHCRTTDIVREHCKKTCDVDICKVSSRKTCTKGNSWPLCATFAADGLCCKEKYKAFMKLHCCVACYGDAPVNPKTKTKKPTTKKTTTTTTTTTTAEPTTTTTPTSKNTLGTGRLCLDLNAECPKWASKGECTRNAGYMSKYCTLSCKGKIKVACDSAGLKPDGVCANPLGLASDGTGVFKIKDRAFSSLRGELVTGTWTAPASSARLYFTDDYDRKRIGAWCSPTADVKKDTLQAITVDLGTTKRITYIATQGRDKYFERTSQFKVEYSNNGVDFTPYTINGREKVFQGNCDHITPVLNYFSEALEARFFRYIPWRWNYPCVRMELYGCGLGDAQPAPIQLASHAIAPGLLTAPASLTCGEKPVVVNCKNSRRGNFCDRKKERCNGYDPNWTNYMKEQCQRTCGYC